MAPRSRSARRTKDKGNGAIEHDVTARRVLDRLGKQSGVSYQGARPHLDLIGARIREGCTEQELRIVIAYCARPDGLAWGADPKMSKFLRPETLFAKSAIHKYRDSALSWYRALPKPEQVLGPLPEPVPLELGDDPFAATTIVYDDPGEQGDLLRVIRGG